MTGTITIAELISQPDAWARLIVRLDHGTLTLPLDPATYHEFLLLGSGSSYYLARAAADWMLRRGFNARAVASCEVLLDPYESRATGTKRLAIGFSRSGQSSELLMANTRLRAAGFDLMGIGCTAGSDLLAQVDHPVLVAEGYEDGLVMLRSFTAMLITAQWLFGDAHDRAALRHLPQMGAGMLDHGPALRDLANARAFNRFVYLGSGPQHPLTQEAALKVQEMAMATSEAYYSMDYRHGPKGCADADTMVTLFTLSDRTQGLALARDIRDLGASLIVIGPDAAAYADLANLTIKAGTMNAEPAAAALLIPAQLFAYFTALRRGQNPDAPVNLAKVVVL